MSNIVEIVIDNPNNRRLYFDPLGQSIRGRFDYSRIKERNAAIFTSQFPDGIPGQGLRVDLDSKHGTIVENIHKDRQVKAILSKHHEIAEDQDVGEVHVSTWLHWMKRAVENGTAKLVAGKFPDKIDDEPQLTFFRRKVVSKVDKLVDALSLIAYAIVPEKQRKDVLVALGRS